MHSRVHFVLFTGRVDHWPPYPYVPETSRLRWQPLGCRPVAVLMEDATMNVIDTKARVAQEEQQSACWRHLIQERRKDTERVYDIAMNIEYAPSCEALWRASLSADEIVHDPSYPSSHSGTDDFALDVSPQ